MNTKIQEGQEIVIRGTAYRVLKLLGHGKGGYSFLVESSEGQFVLKAIHHEPCSYYSFGDKIAAEERDYRTLLAAGIPIPKMIHLDQEGELILKEYIEGPTVFDLVKDDEDVSSLLPGIREIAERAEAHGINIDYFPTNFVLKNKRLYYVDYECNTYMEQWDFEHWGIKYWSKTPEFLEHLQKRGKN